MMEARTAEDSMAAVEASLAEEVSPAVVVDFPVAAEVSPEAEEAAAINFK